MALGATLAPARRRVLLTGLGAALVLVLVVGVLLVRSAVVADEPVTPVSQEDPGPVVLVPGYGASGAGLASLADVLRTQGRTVAVLDPVGDGTGDLEAQADALDDLVRDLLQRTGESSVDVVGHSAGGVVARIWVDRGDDEGGGSLARRVVTLGSPHHGTQVAETASDLAGDGCPEACRQLRPDSDLLAGLDETPPGPVWVALWTEGDDVVVPADSGSLDGAVAYAVQDVCVGSDVTHGALPSDPAVVSMTLAALARDVPQRPPPAREVCGPG